MKPEHVAAAVLVMMGCAGDAGGRKFSFEARVHGVAPNASTGLTFQNERGWTIALEKADVTLGPVYLNVISAVSSGQEASLSRWVKSAWAGGESHLETRWETGGRVNRISMEVIVGLRLSTRA